ncbi:hypothetical protein TSAR_003789 [Trichomalopsis sarcophagae]|uniref:Strictosidine synthase conserved region domain-containing protein n=1 Tax=Trichomalopsis sarcophagae TaxID=543379 RepID=A0A232FHS5_9HYME|nr:hypothetical protein TSAR_003789 [Trichomalopsis sarcophagae]
MGYLKSVGTSVIYIGAFLAAITFIPGIPPDAKFEEYKYEFNLSFKSDFWSLHWVSLINVRRHFFRSVVAPKELTGKLAVNDRLNNAELLFEGQVKGAEAFASYNGELYTGVHGGYVVKVTKNKLIPVVKFGEDCDGLWQESKCGRPLGLKFDKKGVLFVNDAYYGIFKVNVKTGKYEKLVSKEEPIDGKVPMIVNSLDIASNGDIYWSDSSTEFSLEDGSYTTLSNPSGRLIRYNAATKKNQVLLQDLAFANGVALSEDEDFVIVLETIASRITKYHLKGPKAGKHEIFVEGLPGMPDNVHSDNRNGFLVSLVVYGDSENPIISTSLMPHPFIRRMAARLLALIEAPFKCLNTYYPNPYAEKIVHFIGGFESMKGLTSQTVVVLRIDNKGNILDAAYSTDEKISGISSAYIHDGYLWLGSPFAEYVARVPLKKAFPDLAVEEKHSQSTRSTEQVKKNSVPNTEKQPKPSTTTTTPKPVETKPVTPKPVESKPTTAKPVESKPTTAKPVQTKPVTPKPVESKPTTAKPVESKTTTAKPIESKTTTTKPVESKTTTKPNAKKTTKEQKSSQPDKKTSEK